MLRKLMFMSDLHLRKSIPKIKAISPILCLAGDIGNPSKPIYTDFLRSLQDNDGFDKIFMIAGNHEYYDQKHTMEETNLLIYDIIDRNKFNKISFLNNSGTKYKDLYFIGTTLWSKIDDTRMKRFTSIHDMTVDKYNFLHAQSYQYVKQEMQRQNNIVLITHHLPSYKLIHKDYNQSRYLQYYASNSDDLITEPIKAIIHGHTHRAHKLKINDIPIVCNPIGYPDETTGGSLESYIEL